jgi:tRNA(adenine34) deaminase
MSGFNDDEKWMRLALKLAKRAAALGEVPVGAVLVGPDGIIAQGFNQRETLNTPLGHAEATTLHRAAKRLQSWRLENTTLYVTLEPCLMCAGALLQARVSRVVYGANDPKGGAVESLYKTFQDKRLNHQIEITAGVLEKQCAQLLQDFFQQRRDDYKNIRDQKVYRERASVIVVHKNKVLGFHAVDPTSQKKYFFMPGGQIEPGETPEQTAVRETFEETGYKIRLLPNQQLRRRYDFEWNGKINHCDTLFFVGVLDEEWHQPWPVQDADYNIGSAWIPVKEVDAIFGYHPDILWGVRWGMKRSPRK